MIRVVHLPLAAIAATTLPPGQQSFAIQLLRTSSLVAVNSQAFLTRSPAIYFPVVPMPAGASSFALPILKPSPWQALRAQTDQQSTAIYQPTPPPPGATLITLPVRAASPWSAIRAQADQVGNTINQPVAAVALPPGQTVGYVPIRTNNWVALNAQTGLQGASAIYQVSPLPVGMQAISPAPRALNPWAAINAQANLESLAIYITPAAPTPMPPGASVFYVPPGLSRWAAITAMANLEGNFLPLIPPPVPPTPDQPFQGAGNNMRGRGNQHGGKKKKKELIREAVEEAYQRAIAENPERPSASILKYVALAPEVKALDNVRLQQIIDVLAVMAAERDEDDAEALLLFDA